MRQYRFDIEVKANYEATNYHVSRNGKELCYFDKTSGRVEVTGHCYRNVSAEIKRQAIETCEKLATAAGGK